MIHIFTPSFADADNTNAQNLTVKEVVARLPENLFRVTMLCWREPDPRIAARKNTRLLFQKSHANALIWSAAVLTAQPDIYYFPRTGPLDAAVFAMRKAGLLHSKIVSYIVMVMAPETEGGLIGRSVTEGDVVTANSSFVAHTVKERFGIQPRVVYDGVDRRSFFPRSAPPSGNGERATVLYAGSFQERKRVDLVIRQAARFPQVAFRLAGKGPTEAACRALAEQFACRNVTFLGHLQSAELGEEMRHADVFLFPSILEGHPQVLVQAAASGLPAIAMNEYRPEYVVNGETGFIVESDAELEQKLDVLLGNVALRQSMSAAAAKHALKFDWQFITDHWGEVFREAAAR
jgi:glycosyltransferase involved in cell wall biosynthesis